MVKITAIDYAETKLGVHSVHENLLAISSQMTVLLAEIAEARMEKRKVEESVEDYEMNIAASERGKQPTMSATAFKEHLKGALHADHILKELRGKVAYLADVLDQKERVMRVWERDVMIGCARLNELGGYLNYLAAAKLAVIKSQSGRNGEN